MRISGDAVFKFLQANGGEVPHADFLANFKPYIRGNEDAQAFMKVVNQYAVIVTSKNRKLVRLKRPNSVAMPQAIETQNHRRATPTNIETIKVPKREPPKIHQNANTNNNLHKQQTRGNYISPESQAAALKAIRNTHHRRRSKSPLPQVVMKKVTPTKRRSPPRAPVSDGLVKSEQLMDRNRQKPRVEDLGRIKREFGKNEHRDVLQSSPVSQKPPDLPTLKPNRASVTSNTSTISPSSETVVASPTNETPALCTPMPNPPKICLQSPAPTNTNTSSMPPPEVTPIKPDRTRKVFQQAVQNVTSIIGDNDDIRNSLQKTTKNIVSNTLNPTQGDIKSIHDDQSLSESVRIIQIDDHLKTWTKVMLNTDLKMLNIAWQTIGKQCRFNKTFMKQVGTYCDEILGYNCIHHAVVKGDLEVIRFAVKTCGVSINSITKGTCNTALHLAIKSGKFELIKPLLTEFKADPSLRNTSGKRPVDLISCDSVSYFSYDDDMTEIKSLLKGAA